MKLLKNKSKLTIISLFLMVSMIATSIFSIAPITNGQAVQNSNTHIYANAAPNPVGVGQNLLISVWTAEMPPDIGETSGLVASPTGRNGWADITVELTKPDGNKENVKLPYTDPVGATWTMYVPGQTGTYYLHANFPAVWKNTTTTKILYKESISNTVNVTVQQEPVKATPEYPLPTEYWTYPISSEDRLWYNISGNWLASGTGRFSASAYDTSGNFNPYTNAPNTAHIIWTKPIAFGGLIGGEYEANDYYTGLAYETKFGAPIIINGKLYYNTPDPPRYGFMCVDLLTGEQVWWKNGTITMGQIYDYNSPNQHGGIPYLWRTGTTYEMYDAFTGNLILTLANATSPQTGGTQKANVIISDAGDMLVYILNGANNWLAMWNSSKVSGMLLGTSGTNYWQWRPPTGATLDWRTGIQWNVTVPDVPGTQSIQAISADVIVAAYIPSKVYPTETVQVAYDAKTGKQLWAQNLTLPMMEMYKCALGAGVYIVQDEANLQWIGFDALTGKQLWVTDPCDNPLSMYIGVTHGGGWAVAYGKFYTLGYDGRIHAYDVKTGSHLWDFYAGNSGADTPWGTWPFGGTLSVADGKIYVGVYEDFPDSPMWKGFKLYVADAETGEGVWNVSGWYQLPVLADSHLVAFNAYDQQIYCFGKGPSATTVEAPMSAVTSGTGLVIRGSVTDIAAGTKQNGPESRFPKGVPVVSDDSMSAWMEYVYMQKPRPANATGVPVTIDVIDANGNFRNIGNVTSDSSGMFTFTWKPDIPGSYKVIATFAGSESYWPSSAESSFAVEEPIPTASPFSETVLPPTEMYFAISTAALIVTIIVVGAAIVLILKKRQ